MTDRPEDTPQQIETLYLRVPAPLKERVRSYARRLGITDNAAGAVLLDKALTREGL